jgi:hypothetical protein
MLRCAVSSNLVWQYQYQYLEGNRSHSIATVTVTSIVAGITVQRYRDYPS